MLTFAQFIAETHIQSFDHPQTLRGRAKLRQIHESYESDSRSPSEARAEKYFSIGHGDYNDEHGFEPDYHVWAHINGKIHKSKRIKAGGSHDETHGSLWSHDVTNRSYKGRYEPQTGHLSIVKPHHAQFSEVPSHVMHGLHHAFKNIKHVHEF